MPASSELALWGARQLRPAPRSACKTSVPVDEDGWSSREQCHREAMSTAFGVDVATVLTLIDAVVVRDCCAIVAASQAPRPIRAGSHRRLCVPLRQAATRAFDRCAAAVGVSKCASRLRDGPPTRFNNRAQNNRAPCATNFAAANKPDSVASERAWCEQDHSNWIKANVLTQPPQGRGYVPLVGTPARPMSLAPIFTPPPPPQPPPPPRPSPPLQTLGSVSADGLTAYSVAPPAVSRATSAHAPVGACAALTLVLVALAGSGARSTLG